MSLLKAKQEEILSRVPMVYEAGKAEANASLDEIKRAIWSRGGDIAEDAKYADVPPAIYDLPVGDPKYLLVEDSNISTIKQILSGASKCANIDSFGGMTHRVLADTPNLVPIDKLLTQANGTTLNGDGTFRVSMSQQNEYINFGDFHLKAGKYTFYLDIKDYPEDNGVFLNNGFFATMPDENGEAQYIYFSEGSTEFTLTKDTDFELCEIELCATEMKTDCTLVLSLREVRYELQDAKITSIVSKDKEGSIIDTITIPTEIQALTDYGKGTSNGQNTVDLATQKYIRNVRTKVLIGDSTEGWWFYAGYKGEGYCYAAASVKPSGMVGWQTSICSHFENENNAASATGNKIGKYMDYTQGKQVYFITDKPTLTEWQAWLAAQNESGTPVELTYTLASPIETDLGVSLTSLLKVEAGGYLEFVTDTGRGVPNAISYLRRVE